MTKRTWMKSAIAALAVMLVAVGCDSVGTNELTGPSRDPNADVITYLLNGVQVVQETDATVGTVTGTFDEDGGVLMLGEHKLIIPAGAVDREVVFKMRKSSSALKFDLTATSKGSIFTNNIGSQGFDKPVKLSISYDGANVGDPTVFEVAWLKLLGNEVQPSTIDEESHAIVGELDHFSDYALIWP